MEIYAGGTWQTVSAASALQQARRDFTATKLADGRLLAVGGVNATATLATSELYNPDAFTLGAALVSPPVDPSRFGHTATLLKDGRVLVTGGSNFNRYAISSAELYNGPPGP